MRRVGPSDGKTSCNSRGGGYRTLSVRFGFGTPYEHCRATHGSYRLGIDRRQQKTRWSKSLSQLAVRPEPFDRAQDRPFDSAQNRLVEGFHKPIGIGSKLPKPQSTNFGWDIPALGMVWAIPSG